jgi:glycine/D-amino acid oxidase-like deaminating enzyme
MSVSYWMQNQNQNKVECDVAIVGGGISGLSAAYWMSKIFPQWKIVLVEKGQLGSGATGRNAGFITGGSVEHFNRMVEIKGRELALKIWHFSEENHRLLKQELLNGNENKVLYDDNGSFSLAGEQTELDELEESARLMKECDIEVSIFSKQKLSEKIDVANFAGGILYHQDGSIHPLKLLSLLKQKLNRVEFLENEEVHAIEEANGKVELHGPRHLIKAEACILAGNGHLPLMNPFFSDKIVPTRGQVLATAPVDSFVRIPCYANFVLDYFRQLPTGELIIGGFRQLQKDTEVGYSDETNPIIQEALSDFIAKHLPRAKEAKVTHRWSGIMGFSQDGLPMIGSLASSPQVFYLGGHTAHGLGMAFHCAKVLACALNGKEIPHFLSGRRF